MIKITLIKGNMGQHNFKKFFEFNSFSEIYYYGMTRLRNTSLGVFIRCQYTRTILRNKNLGQSLFLRNIESFQISMKYFTVAWPNSVTRIWTFSYNVSTKEPFYKTNIWERVCLRHIPNSKNSMKHYTVEWPGFGRLN